MLCIRADLLLLITVQVAWFHGVRDHDCCSFAKFRLIHVGYKRLYSQTKHLYGILLMEVPLLSSTAASFLPLLMKKEDLAIITTHNL